MSSTFLEPLRFHLQEKGCIYSYGKMCLTCINISNLIGRIVCSILRSTISLDLNMEHTFPPTRLLILMVHTL